MDMPDTIGGLLRALRERAGMTHRQVGAHLGVHATLVGRWEDGSRALHWDRAVQMLDLYGATASERHLATQLRRHQAA